MEVVERGGMRRDRAIYVLALSSVEQVSRHCQRRGEGGRAKTSLNNKTSTSRPPLLSLPLCPSRARAHAPVHARKTSRCKRKAEQHKTKQKNHVDTHDPVLIHPHLHTALSLQSLFTRTAGTSRTAPRSRWAAQCGRPAPLPARSSGRPGRSPGCGAAGSRAPCTGSAGRACPRRTGRCARGRGRGG